MSVNQIKAELEERWGDDPVAPLCLKIIDYVASLPCDQVRMLTFSTMLKAGDKDHVDEELMRALMILVSSKIAAFDTRALLVDEDEVEYEIDPSELANARATGQIVHPQTGELISNFETRIIPFFVPSARFVTGEP